jgi:hypothetical protein
MLHRTLSVMFLLLGSASCSLNPQPAARPVQVASGPSSRIERGPIAQGRSCFCFSECSATAVFYLGGNPNIIEACNVALAICRNTGCTTCTYNSDSFCQ